MTRTPRLPLLSVAAGTGPSTITVVDGETRLLRVIDLVGAGPSLALTLARGRPLAVAVFAVELLPSAADGLSIGLQLAGGRRAHALALTTGRLTLNRLARRDAALARRYGGTGPGAGWDEVLALPVTYRGAAPPVLPGGRGWLDVTPEAPEAEPEWLRGVVVEAALAPAGIRRREAS